MVLFRCIVSISKPFQPKAQGRGVTRLSISREPHSSSVHIRTLTDLFHLEESCSSEVAVTASLMLHAHSLQLQQGNHMIAFTSEVQNTPHTDRAC